MRNGMPMRTSPSIRRRARCVSFQVERGEKTMRLTNGKRCFIGGVAMVLATTATAAEFPFERELLLEAKPLPGSKRVPMLEILREGRALIDLWCKDRKSTRLNSSHLG